MFLSFAVIFVRYKQKEKCYAKSKKKYYSTNASLQNEHWTKNIFLSSFHSTLCFIWDRLFFILHAMFFLFSGQNENVFRCGC